MRRPDPPPDAAETRQHWIALLAEELVDLAPGARWPRHPAVEALLCEATGCAREEQELYAELICDAQEAWARRGGLFED